MKKVFIFLSLCGAVGVCFAGLSEIFYLNVTESLPPGLYMKAFDSEYNCGDCIIYEPPEEVKNLIVKNEWGDGKHYFLKKIGATAGEKYSIDSEKLTFEIEGKYIGKVFEKDSMGKELPRLRGNFEVPKDCILPIATNERSFDGRYTGVIPISRIKTKVIPIFTL